MATLGVALFRMDKSIFKNWTGDHINEFRLAVNQATSFLDRVVKSGHGIRMIVAPEYFFSSIGPIGQKVVSDGPLPVNRAEKRDLYSDLKDISKQAGDVMIVAGSVYYKKEGHGGTKGLNVCPILRRGKILYEHYKTFDDGNLKKHDSSAKYAHKSTEPVFTVDQVRFGIDICGEHYNEPNVQQHQADNPAASAIDVHLLVSNGAGPNAGYIAARKDGFVIWCDMNEDPQIIQSAANGSWNQSLRTMVPRIKSTTQVMGVSLDVYQLTLV